MLTSNEHHVVAAPDEAELMTTLAGLIACASVGGTSGEVTIQRDLAGPLGDLGLQIDHWPLDLDLLRKHEDYPGEEVEREHAWGLVGVSGPGRPALVLQGHVDVVPPGDPAAWTSDPFTAVRRGDHIVGRGSLDMLGGVAAILSAVGAVRSAGVRLSRPYAVHLVIGEEDGGLGAFATLQRGHDGDACIIPEPTDLQLVTANAGSLTFRIEVPGLATHASTAYAGSSAIDSYLPLHQALHALQAVRNTDPEPLMRDYPVAYPLSVGRLQAGDWPSSVPDRLVAEGRLGLRIEEDPDDARSELEATVHRAAEADPYLRAHPPTVTWSGGQFRGGHLTPTHPLRGLVRSAHQDVLSRPIREHGAPWGSDLRLYTAAGIPTLHYGPGDIGLAHGPDERVPVDQLMATAKVLAVAIIRSCVSS